MSSVPQATVLIAMWFVMMATMMLPAAVPWWRTLAALQRPVPHGTSSPPHGRHHLAWFGGGYLSMLLAYSVLVGSLQLLLLRLGLLETTRLQSPAAGAVLLLAGAHQLLPSRQTCLTHCRNPLSFFLSRWRNGPRGAFRMGLEHGRYCLGCCWALMLIGLAVGLMNFAWMAALTALVTVERLAPRGRQVGRAGGFALLGWGLWILTAG